MIAEDCCFGTHGYLGRFVVVHAAEEREGNWGLGFYFLDSEKNWGILMTPQKDERWREKLGNYKYLYEYYAGRRLGGVFLEWAHIERMIGSTRLYNIIMSCLCNYGYTEVSTFQNSFIHSKFQTNSWVANVITLSLFP